MKTSYPIQISKGFRQGGSQSPILFNFLLDNTKTVKNETSTNGNTGWRLQDIVTPDRFQFRRDTQTIVCYLLKILSKHKR